MWTKDYWKKLAERVVTAAAVAVGAYITTNDFEHFDFKKFLIAIVTGVVLSFAKGIVGSQIGSKNDPGWVNGGRN